MRHDLLSLLPKTVLPTMDNFRYLFLAYLPAPFLVLLEKYALPDPVFVFCIFTLIVFDTILGSIIAWRGGILSSKGSLPTLIKAVCYMIALGTVHVLTMLAAYLGQNAVADYMALVDSALYLYFAYRETISIAENMGKLGHNIFPKWFMAKLRDFTENGTYQAGSGSGVAVAPPEQPANAATEPPTAAPVTTWTQA